MGQFVKGKKTGSNKKSVGERSEPPRFFSPTPIIFPFSPNVEPGPRIREEEEGNQRKPTPLKTPAWEAKRFGDPVTAVASMRRTEALASVKFYQILSIFIFFIRLIILEDFIRLISYNGPCVRLGCSFFLATALPVLENGRLALFPG